MSKTAAWLVGFAKSIQGYIRQESGEPEVTYSKHWNHEVRRYVHQIDVYPSNDYFINALPIANRLDWAEIDIRPERIFISGRLNRRIVEIDIHIEGPG
jgi:hypothetical protein